MAGRLAMLRSSSRENGWFLTMQRALTAIVRRRRDGMLARALRTQGVGLGHNPRIYGARHIEMGAHFSAADGLWLEAVTEYAGHVYTPELRIGERCNLSSFVHIACTHRVTIGDGLLSGSGVMISDHAHGQYRGLNQTGPALHPALRRLSNDGVVTIGRNVWLGDGVVVLAGAEIGDGAIIGANSVVNGPIPAETIAVGSPAKVVRRWDGAAWVRVESAQGGV